MADFFFDCLEHLVLSVKSKIGLGKCKYPVVVPKFNIALRGSPGYVSLKFSKFYMEPYIFFRRWREDSGSIINREKMKSENRIILPGGWERLKSEKGPDLRIFQVRVDLMKNPRNGRELETFVMESGEWVNVVALTPGKKVVVVRQFRFGIEDITTEIPGGLVDPGENSGDAARRELKEETGYTGEKWKYLGAVEPNPAFLNNLCHHWLVEDAVKTHDPDLDDGEDIITDVLSADEIRDEIQAGRLRHSLVLGALSRVFDLWGTSEKSS